MNTYPHADFKPRTPKPEDRQWRIRFMFHGVAVVALSVVLLPVVMAFLMPSFPGKIAGVTLFVVACMERMWAMYLRQGLRSATRGAGRDWSAIAVGYAYALTLGVAAVEFLWRQHTLFGGMTAVGGVIYGSGVALRYWAFSVLRHQWRVDVSDVGDKRHLVREGPYQLMRHPLYFGACLEVVGLPVFLGAWVALLVGVWVFIPLEIARAYYEERFLRDLFGEEYRRYAREVWAFFPLPFTRNR